MKEPIMRAAAIFCCIGMGFGPVMQRYGCCCATVAEIAQKLHDEQCSECCQESDTSAPAPSSCDCPVAAKSFEAVPGFAIKNFADDLWAVEAVFTSPFQGSKPGDSSLWEIVENLRP